jgi:hypothetical protein
MPQFYGAFRLNHEDSRIISLITIFRESSIMPRIRPHLLPTLLLLASCSFYSSSGTDNRQGNYLINTRSLPNYVKTIPVPGNPRDLVLVKKVRLETKHRLSPMDFIYQSKPRPYHGRLYLMDFRRRRIYAEDTPERPYRWIRPLGGRPYRYLYTGKFVALKKDWQAEQEWEAQQALKKEKKKARESSRGHIVALPPSPVHGPLGGAVIQQDENSMTEMLPSGAYVFHPKSELEAAGYHYSRTSGWTRSH